MKETQAHLRILNGITAGWKSEDMPVWLQEYAVISGDLIGKTSTKSIPFVFLQLGTTHRWALMSNPFSAKTKVGSLRPFPGVGRAVIRGRTMMIKLVPHKSPRPGIKTRKFMEKIKKQRQKRFVTAINKAFDRGAKRVFTDKAMKAGFRPLNIGITGI